MNTNTYTPDYVRCGQHVYFITWSRLIILTIILCTGVIFLSTLAKDTEDLTVVVTGGGSGSSLLGEHDDHTMTTSTSMGRRTDSLLSSDSSLTTASPSRLKLHTLKPGEIIASFCTNKASTYYLSKWKPVCLNCEDSSSNGGGGDWPNDDGIGKTYCDWLEKTTTQIPFRMCTFDRNVDTQISAYLHKEGAWNIWKKGIIEEILPRLREGATVTDPTVRTIVIDIGSNIGFYTVLSAVRGYDVVSIEPSRESLIRQLYSLAGNNIKVARKNRGDVIGRQRTSVIANSRLGNTITSNNISPTGPRKALVHVFQNAASDMYSNVNFDFIKDNPGASFINTAGNGQSVSTVFIDDLVQVPNLNSNDKSHGNNNNNDLTKTTGGFSTTTNSDKDFLPLIDPLKVRLIKISAEGMDSRVLHGMRKLLSYGKIPFIIFVYNDAHVRNVGCDPANLITSLLQANYSLWHAGTWFKRTIDVQRFIKGMTTRSIELLFVGPDVTWA